MLCSLDQLHLPSWTSSVALHFNGLWLLLVVFPTVSVTLSRNVA